MDIFEILGICPTTDKTVIKSAYHKAWGHVLGDYEATQQLNEAYEMALKYADAGDESEELTPQLSLEHENFQVQTEQEQASHNTINRKETVADTLITHKSDEFTATEDDLAKENNNWNTDNEIRNSEKQKKAWFSFATFAAIFLLQWYARNVWFATPILMPEEQELMHLHHELIGADHQGRTDELLDNLIDLLLDNENFQSTLTQEELDAQIEDLLRQLDAIGVEEDHFLEFWDEVWDLLEAVDALLWYTDL